MKLSYKYKQPLTYIIYYGQLQYSGISDYSIYDMIIASDVSSSSEVDKCNKDGCKVIQYTPWGSRFEDNSTWMNEQKYKFATWKNNGLANGIFFDECEVGYWDLSYYEDPEKVKIFQDALQEACDYCKSLGLITVVNGVSGLSQCGDYWLWESFGGYWNTNRLDFKSTGTGTRTVAADGAITYNLNFSEWTLSGFTVSGNKIVPTGSGTGYIEIEVKPEDYLVVGDQLSQYDWVYYEWKGSGGTNDNCIIYAWYKDNWVDDWTPMPSPLFSGEPNTWNGINKLAKYLKIRMEFTNASSLEITNCFINYGYNYPYFDMTKSNEPADSNPQYWNYNLAQMDYIQERLKAFKNNKTKLAMRPMAHSFGLFTDNYRLEYTFLLANLFELYSWDYTHPLHQLIEYTDILDDPFGMLLSFTDNGSGSYSGTFTGCSGTIDVKNNTYSITKTKPSYWYDRAITIDGSMSDWSSVSANYSNSNSATLDIYLREIIQDFSSGSFDNVYIHDDGFLTLVDENYNGTWTSAELTATGSRLSKLQNILFGIAGDVTIQIRYKRSNNSWSGYSTYSYNQDSIDEEFKAIQIKLTFNSGGWVTCWAYSLYYKITLIECLNIREFKITDDNSYLYLYAKFNDVIDMDTHIYNIYFYTKTDADTGFIGDWWETSYGVHFFIYNTSLYRWDDTHANRKDTDGFEYLGHIFKYELSANGKEIEYSIKKSLLKNLEASQIKVYVLISEAVTNYAALINPSGVDTSTWPVTFSGEMLYTQKEYHNYSPHGYYRSEEIFLQDGNNGYSITFSKTTPASTSGTMYTRHKKIGGEWSAWAERTSGYTFNENVQVMQYCASLNTTNKANTPYFENICVLSL